MNKQPDGETKLRSDKLKFDLSIFFEDISGNNRFLFRVLNIGGKDRDDLKFIFIPPVKNIAFVYGEHPEGYHSEDIMGSYGEISYHSDGSMLHKLTPFETNDSKPVYRNPKGQGERRTPLANIWKWEPIIRITIRDYDNCRITKSQIMTVLPHLKSLFNGDTFICDLFLGHELNPDPLNKHFFEQLIFRIPGVASNVDLCCWVYKREDRGRLMRLGENSEIAYSFRVNEIQVIEQRRDYSRYG